MDAIKIFFELIRPIGMPWQVAIFVFTSAIVIYWIIKIGTVLIALFGKIGLKLTEWLVRLLLLPEFLITSFFRLIKIGSIPGTDSYDDLIETINVALQNFFRKISTFQGKDLKFPMGWIILLIIFIVVVWYLREVPDYQNTTFSEYVDGGFSLYYKLQSKVFSH